MSDVESVDERSDVGDEEEDDDDDENDDGGDGAGDEGWGGEGHAAGEAREVQWLEETDEPHALPVLLNSTARRRKTLETYIAPPHLRQTVLRCQEFPHGVYIDSFGIPRPDDPRSNTFWKRSEWRAREAEAPETTDKDATDQTSPEEEEKVEIDLDEEDEEEDDDPARSEDDEEEQKWKRLEEKQKGRKRRRTDEDDDDEWQPAPAAPGGDGGDGAEEEDGDDDDESDSEDENTEDEEAEVAAEVAAVVGDDEDEASNSSPDPGAEVGPEAVPGTNGTGNGTSPGAGNGDAAPGFSKALDVLRREAEANTRMVERSAESKRLYLQSQQMNVRMGDWVEEWKKRVKSARGRFGLRNLPLLDFTSNFLAKVPVCQYVFKWRDRDTPKVTAKMVGRSWALTCECGERVGPLPEMLEHLMKMHRQLDGSAVARA